MQYAAMASQKFTWPCFTAVVPASTVAVSVTTLPAFTEVTATPPEVTASEVVEFVRANAEELIAAVHTISAIFSNSNGRRATVLTDANWSGKNMWVTPITARLALAPATWKKRDEHGSLDLTADLEKKFAPSS